MWGIDQWKRPYITIKYVYDQTIEGVVTFFQRFTESGPLVLGGDSRLYLNHPSSPLNPTYRRKIEFLANLTSFFKGENVASPKIYGKIGNFILAK